MDRPHGDPPDEDLQPTEPVSDRGSGSDSSSGTTAPMHRLGDFELLRELGRGGMGVVYEARQVSLKRRVALKVLPPALGMSAQAKQRFEREAQAAAKLHHTNIVPVHAIGEHEGHHYYAMDLIEGQSLDRVLREVADQGSNPLLAETVTRDASELSERPPPATESKPPTTSGNDSTTSLGDTSAGSRPWFDAVAKLIAEVADGLDYAHGRGVIHRDIKPANLMLSSEGRLCITDFGLARIVQEPGMTVSGSFLGTPAYMSPEQIAAGRVKLDHRTDVYSLGAVLYEMLTLQRPFPGDSREEVLSAIMAKDPRPPRKFNGKIPQDLETICLKALEKDPDRRYATAGDLAQDLRQYLQHGLIAAKRAGLLRRAAKSVRRHPVVAISALAIVLLGSVGGFAWRALRKAEVPRLVSEARLLMTQGDDEGALETSERLLALEPENIDARLIRARVFLHRYEFWEAVDEARAALEHDPENWEAHLVIAAAAKKGNLYSIPVREHLDAVEGNIPDTADGYFLRGWIAHREGQLREALGWLDRALELDPGHALALEDRSDTYMELRDLPAALADADRLLASRPSSRTAVAQRVAVLRWMHEDKLALKAAERILEADPKNFHVNRYRSRIHLQQGRTEKAIDDLTRCIELDPDSGHFLLRGHAFSNAGEFDQALADYRRAIELNPDELDAYTGSFRAHWAAGRQDEARAALGALETRAESWVDDPSLASYHMELASLYQQLKDHDRALAEAQRAVELRPDWVHARWGLVNLKRSAKGQTAIAGDCDRMAALALDEPDKLLVRGRAMVQTCQRTEQALADYGKAIELAPSWSEPYARRAELYAWKLKDYEKARADYDKTLELTPSWLNAVFYRAQLFMQLERFEEALADMDRCKELGGDGSNLRRQQMLALFRLGRETEGLEVLEDFLAERPNDHWGHAYLGEARFLIGQVAEAVEALDRAIEISEGFARGYHDRAAISRLLPGSCQRVRDDVAKLEELMSGGELAAWKAGLMVARGSGYCRGLDDVAVALELAREGAAYDPQNAAYQQTLGIALYRNGRFGEAQEVLLKTTDLRPHEDPGDLFFLAMAASGLGKAREARSFYDRAVTRMNATFPKNALTIRVKQEAAEVLGL